MRQVGADDDQRSLAGQRIDDRRYLAGTGAADHDRNQGKVSQHRLQERQLDLEAVLLAVRLVRLQHPG